jgi:glycosyltransferase involved in cell wall biosynthesis
MLSYKIRVHHHLKKATPRWLQIAIRSRVVMRKWNRLGRAWPTYEPVIPEGWRGWPDGKRFALVLTHDVDTAKGSRRCLEVADFEHSLGLKSSFNFVIGDYEVSTELREELLRRGFEVGIHGLHHSSSLYHSWSHFLRQSIQINKVLREWNVVGFRSPCMYHNLEWLRLLDIEYDSSTFDIDPFEPQPDGMHTFFPFSVHDEKFDRSYVELPYTLPQDFTVFVLMNNRNIDIWKQKLDWVVSHGGMVLSLTHPDYMDFVGKPAVDEYPASYYKELLKYVMEKYEGMYWTALPRDVARFWSSLNLKPVTSKKEPATAIKTTAAPVRTSSRVKPIGTVYAGMTMPGPTVQRRICMPAYTFYEQDNRVRRYAEALVERGDLVDVIALKQGYFPPYEIMNGVHVYRIQERPENQKGRASYLMPLLKFLVNSAILLSRKQYDLVHVHSVPDFEVFAALIPKFLGAKIILDIHDIVPEFYASKFKTGQNSFAFKALTLTEKACIRFSDHVIVSNHLWEKKLVNRSAPQMKCTTILNYPDTPMFLPQPQMDGAQFIAIYPGSFQYHQGLDIAIRAFEIVTKRLFGVEFHLYGSGPEEQSLRTLVSELGLKEKVIFKGSLPLQSMWQAMACASVGVVPKRNDSFGGEAFSTKVFEFMSFGVPVILSKTSIDQFYFDSSIVEFFEPGNYRELAEAIVSLALNKDKRVKLVKNALQFIDSMRWDKKKCDYFNLVDKLLNG